MLGGGAGTAASELTCGVPQGSVLGPLLYILYTADVVSVVETSGIRCHLYADDIQLYGSGSVSSSHQLSTTITDAVGAVGQWMTANKLKLNINKTQYMWLGTPHKLSQVDGFKNPVTSLGVVLDPDLSMRSQINKLCRKCFFQLQRLRAIRRYLTVESTKALACSFICNRIDFCNVMMYGINLSQQDDVQSVLNAAARLVAGVSRFNPIYQYIRDELHWLRMPERVIFKLALLVRDCLAGDAPIYLREQIQLVSETQFRSRLRSSKNGDLIIPKFKSSHFGKRRFSVSSAQIWNALPTDLKIFNTISRSDFKKRLKNHLFNIQQRR